MCLVAMQALSHAVLGVFIFRMTPAHLAHLQVRDGSTRHVHKDVIIFRFRSNRSTC